MKGTQNMKYKTTIVLGDTYRDRVSGWEGTATAAHFYMNNCVRVTIDGHDENGKPKGFVFDEEQLEHVPEVSNVKPEASRSGGPKDSTPVAR